MSLTVQQVPQHMVAELADKALGLHVTPHARAIAATGADGSVHGFVLYDRWTHSAVEMHVCLPHPIAARALRYEAFRYPFLQASREVALGAIRATNRRSRELARHLGFREVHRVRDGWAAGEDLVLLEMHKSECRWLTQPQRKAA